MILCVTVLTSSTRRGRSCSISLILSKELLEANFSPVYVFVIILLVSVVGGFYTPSMNFHQDTTSELTRLHLERFVSSFNKK